MKNPVYICIRCGVEFFGYVINGICRHPGNCPICGSMYFKWLNYKAEKTQ